jgi:hypothetical protein
MARILDTTPAFDAFARKSALETPVRRELLWKERYEKPNAHVFEAFHTAVGEGDGLAALVRELSRVRTRVEVAAPIVRRHITELEPALQSAFDMPDDPSPVHVLMVGTFTANATVANMGDDVAVLHCLEWFQSEDGARVLVAHETTHAYQRLASGERHPPEDDAGWLAFSEGLAIRTSREVVPGKAEDDYYWYGHPEVADWLPWCKEHAARLVERFAGGIDESWTVEAFFGGGMVDGQWRVGQFVADQLVSRIDKPLPELVRMTPDEARAAIKSVL